MGEQGSGAISVRNGKSETVSAVHEDAVTGGRAATLDVGEFPPESVIAANAVRACGLPTPMLLEAPCGSSNYRNVFTSLLNGTVDHTGFCPDTPPLDLALEDPIGRPAHGESLSTLPFRDDGFDLAFNAALPPDLLSRSAAVAEIRRVSKFFCIFHNVDLGAVQSELETTLNEAEWRLLLARHGLTIRHVWKNADSAANSGPVWTFLCAKQPLIAASRPALLNVGCGGHAHGNWMNLDIAPQSPDVFDHNVTAPLPFPDATFDAVYHSHVLEHLSKSRAPTFLQECLRVLKPGGVLRVAVPDLERICALYLELLAKADCGDEDAAHRYDWILLELLDQMTRTSTGGEMLSHLMRVPLHAEDFIIERIGREGKRLLAHIRGIAQGKPPLDPPHPQSAEEIGHFRLSGEIHQWMYDRFSLARALRDAGFIDCRKVGADESRIPHFPAYQLDTEPDGGVRKPDSLFMEAVKPSFL